MKIIDSDEERKIFSFIQQNWAKIAIGLLFIWGIAFLAR